jgi:hypothetical protein
MWGSNKWINDNNMLVVFDKLGKMFTYSGYKIEISYKTVTDVNDEYDNTLNINCSPNPASDFITITLKPSEGFEASEGSSIQIYNNLGEKVTTPSLQSNATPPKEGNFRINISDLPMGVYFVKVGGETAKFVKM